MHEAHRGSCRTDYDVLVVGAGITGLSAAWLLALHGRRVAVLERTGRVGGLIRSSRRGEFQLEHGPFTVMPRSPLFRKMLQWAEADGGVTVEEADRRARGRRYVWNGQRLVAIHGRLGPLRTRLYGWRAKARLVRGLLWSSPGRPAFDTTLFEAVTRRFGKPFAQWAVDPLVRGIVAGDIRRLSVEVVSPRAATLDRSVRSPLGALLRARWRRAGSPSRHADLLPAPPPHAPPPRPRRALISLAGGLETLPQWLADRIGHHGGTLRLGLEVGSIEGDREGVEVHTAPRDGRPGEVLAAPAVILTGGAPSTAALLRATSPEASDVLATIRSASLVVVHLAIAAEHLPDLPRAFGFLVPSCVKDVRILGALFASATFPSHAPRSHHLLRVFLGGPGACAWLDDTDEAVVEAVLADLRRILGLRGVPDWYEVDRFDRAIPQYEPGHRTRLARIDGALAGVPGLILAGSYRGGVSVVDRIESGAAAAASVLAQTA